MIKAQNHRNISKLIILLILLFPSSLALSVSKSTDVYWQSWDLLDISGEGGNEPGSIQILQGFTGSTKGALEKSSDGATKNGDLIELGYFDTGTDSPNTDDTNLFIGTWTPLTSTATIGLYPDDNSFTPIDGEFYLFTTFSQNDGDNNNKAQSLLGSSRAFTDTIGASLSNDIAGLDTATISGSGTYARLGIRFYDVSQSADTGGTTKANGTTRYNTIMSETWRWIDTSTSGNVVQLALHNPTNQAATTGLVFEFDNSDGDGLGAKFGTGDTAVGTDDYVASVTYYDGSSGLALNTIGSSILSGLTGTGTISDGGSGKTLTIHSNAGNTGSNAYAFDGTITGDTKILKTGSGEQKFTSTLTTTDTTGYLDIKAGTVTFAPNDSGSGVTQSIEYLTGSSGTLAFDNDNDADQTLTFGLSDSSHVTNDRTYSGAVTLSDSGANTLKVSSGTADADYNKLQELSGVIADGAGTATLNKTGVGKLKLSGNNTFGPSSGSVGVNINDGTLILAGATNNAAGAGNISVNKGKLEIANGRTISNTLTSDNSGRSFIGGTGKISTVSIGSANGNIDVLSPGEGISSSLNLANKQAPRGNEGDEDLSIGTFNAGTLNLLNGGVYDWEIKDFNDGGTAGTNWDLMKFDALTFGGSSDKFTINIMGLDSNGAAGSPLNGNLWSESGSSFKFLEYSGSGTNVNWGAWNSGNINDYFDFRFDDLAYNTNMWGQAWDVTYSSNAFHLNFSAAPEPSTYIMVTGLFMLPGYRWIRRFRKGLNSKQELKDEV